MSNLKEIQKLKPFTRFCCTIGAIPSSYLISLTYEEQLLWLCNYLESKVVPTVDNNAEVVIELQNYIKSYFTNLNVQDEINAKLDEMAEDGTLEEIIASYLNSKSLLTFKTVEDMKNADNLIEGSLVKTLGFYSLNDTGSAIYKVRNVTNEDNVNEKNIIALNNPSLVAEIIIANEIISPVQLGAKYDGITDDTESWDLAINYAKNLGLSKIEGLRKLSAITKTLIVPVNLMIDTIWLSVGENAEFTNNFMVFFNTNDGLNWITPFNNATYSVFKNIRLNNEKGGLLNGLLIAGNVTIENFKTNGLDISSKTTSSYIDVVNMKNIDIGGKVGSNYSIDLGFLGDAVTIDTIHIHDTNYDAGGVNNLLITGTGKNPCLLSHIINGNVFAEGGIVEINGMHGESNSKITCSNGTFKLSNIYMWAGNEPSIVLNNAKVTLENFINRYNYLNSYTNDNDITLSGTSFIVFSNCYKDILHANDINKHFRTKIKTNLGDYVQEPFLGMCGNIANNGNANNSKTNACITRNANDYYINSPTSAEEGHWLIESSTYHYMAHLLVDNVRMIGYGYDHRQSRTMTQNENALKFASVPSYSPIRIYRGLADNLYNKYIDIVNFDSSIIDNGIICAGLLWKDREAGAKDPYMYASQVEWVGNNVIVWAGSIPSSGTWKTGDIIIADSPASGSPKGWICSQGGTPGTWVSLGNL